MTRQQSSFLLRCWSRNGIHERIQVEHIQSGEQFVASTVAEVVAWICAHDAVAQVNDDAEDRSILDR